MDQGQRDRGRSLPDLPRDPEGSKLGSGCSPVPAARVPTSTRTPPRSRKLTFWVCSARWTAASLWKQSWGEAGRASGAHSAPLTESEGPLSSTARLWATQRRQRGPLGPPAEHWGALQGSLPGCLQGDPGAGRAPLQAHMPHSPLSGSPCPEEAGPAESKEWGPGALGPSAEHLGQRERLTSFAQKVVQPPRPASRMFSVPGSAPQSLGPGVGSSPRHRQCLPPQYPRPAHVGLPGYESTPTCLPGEGEGF